MLGEFHIALVFFTVLEFYFIFFLSQVEYMLVELDEKNEKACLVLNGNKVLDMLQEKGEKVNPK